jgi:heterodisulfide reductase subunit A
MSVGAVLVVGGGIGGIQASLDLADAGFKVYLMDRSPSIGGVMTQLDKTFPTNDCAMCILAPKLVTAGRHQNIDVIPYSELKSVEGSAGDFRVVITKRAMHVNAEKCTGCGICMQECPTRAIDEYNEGLSQRSSAYVKFPQAVPLMAVIDRENCIGCGICKSLCKAKAIEYDQVDSEMELEAGSIILAPGFDEFDPSVIKEYGYGSYPNVLSSIEFERMLSASGPFGGTVIRPSDGEIPRKVAFVQCVGSRDERYKEYCSSVCCMYSMKEAVIAKEHTQGIEPSIFFMDLRAFGKEFDDYYTRAQKEYGIRFVRARVAEIVEDEDRDLILKYSEDEEPMEEKFDMVVLAVGMNPPKGSQGLSKTLGVELNQNGFCSTSTFSPLDTSVPGIYVCGAFSSPKDIPDTVAQASGAAARAAGLIYGERNKLVKVKEFPPQKDVTGQEPRIGVFICHCGINIGGVVDVPEVTEYAKTLPNVAYAECNLYTCSEDTQKRIKEAIKEHDLNRVIVASCTPRTHETLFQETIQEAGLNPYLFEFANIRDQCSWVHMHEPEKATEKAKDLVRMAVGKASLLVPLERGRMGVTPEALVIGGGLSGMIAAQEIAKQGFQVHLVEKTGELGGNLRRIHYTTGEPGKEEDPQSRLRELIDEIEEDERIQIYRNSHVKEIEGYIGNFKSTIMDDAGNRKEVEHGVVVVATGGEEYKPKEYLYGKDERVLTQLELEERLGEVISAKSVVMIQCVGSRNEERSYCSRVCCTGAINNALKLKELNPDVNICILFKDIRTYGFKELYYKAASEKGITFARYDDAQPPVVEVKGEGISVTFPDPTLNEEISLNSDLLVLSSAILPPEGNEELAKMLKVPLSKDGFFLEAHMKLRPVEFATDGIFLCGMAHSPKFIEESISSACAAASKACSILSKPFVEGEAVIARINEVLCSGCGACIEVCPAGALSLEGGKAAVNETLCKGCGLCAATCRAGAIQQKRFEDIEVMAMIDAALEEL